MTGTLKARSNRGTSRPSIVVVDERPLMAEALVALLTDHGLRATHVAPSAAVGAPLGDGVALVCVPAGAIGAIVEALSARGWRVVLHGTTDDTALAVGVGAGAVGILAHTSTPEDLLAVVGRASSGLPLVDPAERDRLMGHLRRLRTREEPHGFRVLTDRERQILAALMDGRRPAEIAADDFVSVTTVRNQVQSILTKLNVHSQLEAVALARRLGWRPDGTPVPIGSRGA